MNNLIATAIDHSVNPSMNSYSSIIQMLSEFKLPLPLTLYFIWGKFTLLQPQTSTNIEFKF